MTRHSVTLVIGGARSGKSRYAETLVRQDGLRPVYIATAEARDDEMVERIRLHRTRRGPEWETVEEPLALAETVQTHAGPTAALLVDCLTLWLGNLLEAGRDPGTETARLASVLTAATGPIVLVTNEVGWGIVPDNALARVFRDHAGRLNQTIAAAADHVVLVVAGLSTVLK